MTSTCGLRLGQSTWLTALYDVRELGSEMNRHVVAGTVRLNPHVKMETDTVMAALAPRPDIYVGTLRGRTVTYR